MVVGWAFLLKILKQANGLAKDNTCYWLVDRQLNNGKPKWVINIGHPPFAMSILVWWVGLEKEKKLIIELKNIDVVPYIQH